MYLRSVIRAGRRLAPIPSIILLLVAPLALAAGAKDEDRSPEHAGEIRTESPDPAAVTHGGVEGGPSAAPEEVWGAPSGAQPEGARLSSLDRALALVLESERTELARLQSAFDAAPDAETALAVQRAIDALKQRSELQILEIQLAHFRAEGHEAAVAELEPVVEQMRTTLADLPGVALTPTPSPETEK